MNPDPANTRASASASPSSAPAPRSPDREGEGRRFRKKPVVIEAMQWDGSRKSIQECCRWANETSDDEGPPLSYIFTGPDDVRDVVIWTLEGDHTVSPGDWIIRGVAGEFYPCKPDIFAQTYEPATLSDQQAEGRGQEADDVEALANRSRVERLIEAEAIIAECNSSDGFCGEMPDELRDRIEAFLSCPTCKSSRRERDGDETSQGQRIEISRSTKPPERLCPDSWHDPQTPPTDREGANHPAPAGPEREVLEGRFLADVAAEVERARAKFPGADHMYVALAEEVGEVAKALLEGDDGLYDECVQVGAMAMRLAEEGDLDFPAAATLTPTAGREGTK